MATPASRCPQASLAMFAITERQSPMIYLAYLIYAISGFASGTYLVVTGHPGWAWIPFVLAASVRVREARDKGKTLEADP